MNVASHERGANFRSDLEFDTKRTSTDTLPVRRVLAQKTRLRDKPNINLSKEEFKKVLLSLGFFDSCFNPVGRIVTNLIDNEDGTISDTCTGLMWEKGIIFPEVRYKERLGYIAEINSRAVGGYYDWRLPTVEEAASLMRTRDEDRGLYIDPVFLSGSNCCTWTSDTFGFLRWFKWRVNFEAGYSNCIWADIGDKNGTSVRAVRTYNL